MLTFIFAPLCIQRKASSPSTWSSFANFCTGLYDLLPDERSPYSLNSFGMQAATLSGLQAALKCARQTCVCGHPVTDSSQPPLCTMNVLVCVAHATRVCRFVMCCCVCASAQCSVSCFIVVFGCVFVRRCVFCVCVRVSIVTRHRSDVLRRRQSSMITSSRVGLSCVPFI